MGEAQYEHTRDIYHMVYAQNLLLPDASCPSFFSLSELERTTTSESISCTSSFFFVPEKQVFHNMS